MFGLMDEFQGVERKRKIVEMTLSGLIKKV